MQIEPQKAKTILMFKMDPLCCVNMCQACTAQAWLFVQMSTVCVVLILTFKPSFYFSTSILHVCLHHTEAIYIYNHMFYLAQKKEWVYTDVIALFAWACL